MTPEDFFPYTTSRDAELKLKCPNDGCTWSLTREITRLWFMVREAQQHITEEHDD